MAKQNKIKHSSATVAKAKEVLEFAREYAKTAVDTSDLSNSLFSPEGKASCLFPTPEERSAFLRTREYKEVLKLFKEVPSPNIKEFLDRAEPTKGALHVRLPRSVHLALIAEAKAEGVSLDELCLSKLSAQLRSLV